MNTCAALRNDGRVTCDLPAEHDGEHSGMLRGARVWWDLNGVPVDFRSSEGPAMPVAPEDLGVLTDVEHRAVRRLAEVWRDLCTLTGDGTTRDQDLTEAAAHIHALQQMIMAQAAARAYPHLYRRLGRTLPHETGGVYAAQTHDT